MVNFSTGTEKQTSNSKQEEQSLSRWEEIVPRSRLNSTTLLVSNTSYYQKSPLQSSSSENHGNDQQ